MKYYPHRANVDFSLNLRQVKDSSVSRLCGPVIPAKVSTQRWDVLIPGFAEMTRGR